MSKTSHAILLALITSFCVSAQRPFFHGSGRNEGPPLLRLSSNLVLVPVSVLDSKGRLVGDLTRSDFLVMENSRPQELLSFSRETAPISLGIVFDLSGSMASKLAKARAALTEFLDRLEPDDETFLVTFADSARLATGFVSNPETIRSELLLASAGGNTALYDAVAIAVKQMRRARHERRVLLVISDGGDNHSRFSEGSVRKILAETDIQVHSIGLHERSNMDDPRGPAVLGDLASMTGGQHHMVNDIGELPALTWRMSLSLHDRYLLGYKPAPPGLSDTFRRIDVKVKKRNPAERLYVYARRGYRMP